MAPVYSHEQVIYLMRVARINVKFEATDDEMEELLDLVDGNDDNYQKVRRVGQ